LHPQKHGVALPRLIASDPPFIAVDGRHHLRCVVLDGLENLRMFLQSFSHVRLSAFGKRGRADIALMRAEVRV
jgi:hypothetical protein